MGYRNAANHQVPRSLTKILAENPEKNEKNYLFTVTNLLGENAVLVTNPVSVSSQTQRSHRVQKAGS